MNLNISKVKLVIWDLDETFWKGTLSEGSVERIDDNIIIAQTLVDRGIMNSIVSKNDYDLAMNKLKEWDVDQYFVFPQISWNPKGEIVKRLLQTMGLRAENVIFIDDNPSNLEEVIFYNKGIECVLASNFGKSILNHAAFKGKNDEKHSRLNQYRVLEERSKMAESYSSNDEFLKVSNIRVSVCQDCLNNLERIEELVERTNQLNYTKVRSSHDELIKIITSSEYVCRYIKAKDNFGDYGIIGFYALRNNKLEHFLFSCRILGFGIENYLFNELDYPEITVVGDITTKLDRNKVVDWITKEDNSYTSSAENALDKNIEDVSLLMIGGCDLQQASVYLESHYVVDQEFSTVVNGNEIRTSDTSQLINAKKLKESQKNELCNNLPFFDENVTFSTKLYDGLHDIIVLSVVDDYIRGMYRSKEEGFYIGYGGYYDQKEFRDRYSKETWEYLDKKFDFIGKEDVNIFETNLREIISSVCPNTRLILINGIDLDVSEWVGVDRIERNQEMNSVVDKIVQEFNHVFLLDMRKIVTDKSFLVKQDNRHFNRNTYYKMAQEIARICSEEMNIQGIKTSNKLIVEGKNLGKRIISKLIHVVGGK